MYFTQRQYDLSYVSSNTLRPTHPEIVFTVQASQLNEFLAHLAIVVDQFESKNYFGEEKPFFDLMLSPYGNVRYGYGCCGLFTEDDNEAHFRLQLKRNQLQEVALTMSVLTKALTLDLRNGTHSNEPQQVILETSAKRSQDGAHAIGGYVSSHLIAWLKKKGEEFGGDYTFTEVLDAMREAWCAVTSRERQRWAKECKVEISRDGRFVLDCMGDGTSLSLYSNDFDYTTQLGWCPLNSHNVDLADQQVTLIAGLAKLCELARHDRES